MRQLATVVVLLLVAACAKDTDESDAYRSGEARFVGSERCADCHRGQYEEWRSSHHALAMQPATEDSVLGDFSGASLDYFGERATFLQRDGDFIVEIRQPDGQTDAVQISETFGVAPLQQYLVDTAGGRKQALQYVWDTREKSAGGQRWYHLYSDEYVGPDDPLHWRGRYFNWNFMCAECHSTNLKPGYDIDADTFHTTYDEVSVGCESCHGPGSQHVAEPRKLLAADFSERDGIAWFMNASTGIAKRSEPNVQRQQVESCGRCHSRRSVIASEYDYNMPLAHTHMPSLLERGLYFADGRILDEVYVYGSFLQSKMHAAGVTCTDCHNPHTGTLRAGPEPNDTCATCHLPAVFAAESHAAESTGDCVACHMPATVYMGVDARRDHSFRVPDAGSDPAHYGPLIAAAWEGDNDADLLAAIAEQRYPAIVQATLLTLLKAELTDTQADILRQQLNDASPLVRIAGLRALRRQPDDVRLKSGSALLRDPVRGVRIEAALTYIGVRDLLPIADARAFASAADEYRQSLLSSASMPDAALNLAQFEVDLGNAGAASKLYEHALRIGKDFAPAQHAYGLHLVRTNRATEALAHLRTAAELEPDMPRFVYVYGVALNSLGYADDALATLRTAWRRFPDDRDIGFALATLFARSRRIRRGNPPRRGNGGTIPRLHARAETAAESGRPLV